MRAALVVVLAAVALGGCSSCETAPTTGYEDMNKQIADELQKVGLGAGDVIEVTVYNEEKLSGMHRIDPDGSINFPMIDRVVVEGMTPNEIADEIQRRLMDGFIRSPSVSVFVKEYNSKKVFVLGEVQKSGTFVYAAGMNIVEAITLAGGFLPSANTNYVIVTRHGPDGDQRIPVAVEKITQGEAPNFYLKPGDIVFVPDTLL
ncbi:MAG: polysaccharide export protein [Deltaproteobacteria bacterium]|nr:polysaccharide export protein [Deltaproteobacteria bacterium]